MITVGALFLSGTQYVDDANIPLINVFPILSIVLGSIIFVVAFFGCCGAIKENSCMLTTYTIFLIILCILQIALSSWCWATQKNLIDKAGVYAQDVWDNRAKNPIALDSVQIAGHCCGLNGLADYSGGALPASCCGSSSSNYSCSSQDAYKTGCFEGFTHYFKQYTNWVVIYGYLIAAIELAGVILACCLKGTFHRHTNTY